MEIVLNVGQRIPIVLRRERNCGAFNVTKGLKQSSKLKKQRKEQPPVMLDLNFVIWMHREGGQKNILQQKDRH
jgi:hypothetical protein